MQGWAGLATTQTMGPGRPRRTSLNQGPEQIRRWSNPVPHPLGEGEGPQPDGPALTTGAWGGGGLPYPRQLETTANHSGLTLPLTSTHSERRGHNHTVRTRRGGPQALYFVEEETQAERGSDLSTIPQKHRAWPGENPDSPAAPGQWRQEVGRWALMGTQAARSTQGPPTGQDCPRNEGFIFPPDTSRHRHIPFPFTVRDIS